MRFQPVTLAIFSARLALAHRLKPQVLQANGRWQQLLKQISDLEAQNRPHIAAFDVDGTLIREKPVLAEVQVAREVLCDLSGNDSWPLSTVTQDQVCPAHNRDTGRELPMPSLTKQQTYELLMVPFAHLQEENFTKIAVDLMPRRNLMYAGFADLLRMLSNRGWQILLVSTSLQDFVRAFADVYLPGLSVTVLSSVPESLRILDGKKTRGKSIRRLVAKEEKANIIEEWTKATYGQAMPPLLAVGNTPSDMHMCLTASQGGGLGVMLEHDAADECNACQYPIWGNYSVLHARSLQVLSMNDLPRPLFKQLESM